MCGRLTYDANKWKRKRRQVLSMRNILQINLPKCKLQKITEDMKAKKSEDCGFQKPWKRMKKKGVFVRKI